MVRSVPARSLIFRSPLRRAEAPRPRDRHLGGGPDLLERGAQRGRLRFQLVGQGRHAGLAALLDDPQGLTTLLRPAGGGGVALPRRDCAPVGESHLEAHLVSGRPRVELRRSLLGEGRGLPACSERRRRAST